MDIKKNSNDWHIVFINKHILSTKKIILLFQNFLLVFWPHMMFLNLNVSDNSVCFDMVEIQRNLN